MKDDKSYFTGIIGAILGGILFSIPWIFLYVYANFIFSLCAAIVAIGALKGYKLFKGKISKSLPLIIGITSVVSITFATLIVIPLLLSVKNGGSFSIDSLVSLYSNEEFLKAIIKDYVISMIFTFIGISGTISSIKKQLMENQKDISTPKLLNSDLFLPEKKDFDLIKSVFDKHKSYSLKKAITDDDLKRELGKDYKKLIYFIGAKIIIKEDNKYYYDNDKADEMYEKVLNYDKINKRSIKILIIILSITFLFVIASTIIHFATSDKKDLTNKYWDKQSFVAQKVLSDYYKELKDEKEHNKFYYVPIQDLSYNSGYIVVTYDNKFSNDTDYENLSNMLLELLNNNLKSNYSSSENSVEFVDDYESLIGNRVLEYKFEDTDSVVHIYYSVRNNKFLYIAAQDFGVENIDNNSVAKAIAEGYEF